MTPPSGSPERRLAVLLAHLHPPAACRFARADRNGTTAAAAAEAEAETGAGVGLFASPCAGGKKEVELSVFRRSEDIRCVLCDIVDGTSQAFKLYEDDVCLCILDTKPLASGHSLIIPKIHYPSLQTTPPNVLAAICSKLPLLSTAIMKATQCDAFNVLIKNGEKAGQVIFHTHIHIIPRSKDDNLWSSETYSRNHLLHGQETKNLVKSIKEVLLSSPQDYSTATSSTAKEL